MATDLHHLTLNLLTRIFPGEIINDTQKRIVSKILYQLEAFSKYSALEDFEQYLIDRTDLSEDNAEIEYFKSVVTKIREVRRGMSDI